MCSCSVVRGNQIRDSNGVTNSMLMSINKVPFGGMVRCPNNFVHIVYVFPNGLDDVTREVEQLQKTKTILLLNNMHWSVMHKKFRNIIQ